MPIQFKSILANLFFFLTFNFFYLNEFEPFVPFFQGFNSSSNSIKKNKTSFTIKVLNGFHLECVDLNLGHNSLNLNPRV